VCLLWKFLSLKITVGVISCPRETSSPVNFATVPTAAERQGDFSALLKANTSGNDYTIYNPDTGVFSGGRVQRTPFPNNVIPSSRLNPVSLKYLQYYPQPNLTGNLNGFRNYLVNAIDSDSYDNELARLDVLVRAGQVLAGQMVARIAEARGEATIIVDRGQAEEGSDEQARRTANGVGCEHRRSLVEGGRGRQASACLRAAR